MSDDSPEEKEQTAIEFLQSIYPDKSLFTIKECDIAMSTYALYKYGSQIDFLKRLTDELEKKNKFLDDACDKIREAYLKQTFKPASKQDIN